MSHTTLICAMFLISHSDYLPQLTEHVFEICVRKVLRNVEPLSRFSQLLEMQMSKEFVHIVGIMSMRLRCE